jgi:hypothetical protein
VTPLCAGGQSVILRAAVSVWATHETTTNRGAPRTKPTHDDHDRRRCTRKLSVPRTGEKTATNVY